MYLFFNRIPIGVEVTVFRFGAGSWPESHNFKLVPIEDHVHLLSPLVHCFQVLLQGRAVSSCVLCTPGSPGVINITRHSRGGRHFSCYARYMQKEQNRAQNCSLGNPRYDWREAREDFKLDQERRKGVGEKDCGNHREGVLRGLER